MIQHDPEDPFCKCEDCALDRIMVDAKPQRRKRTLAELYKTARQKGIVTAISTYK